MARKLADAAYWHNQDVERLYEAAYVHDIGKIALPKSILQKASTLTDAEYETIKLHPRLGADILRHEGMLDRAQVEWVLHHHERPDGNGYPDGLTRDRITPGAGILALADAWDAMTSDRTYQKARNEWDAIAIVLDGCNKQFTHQAVCLLERVLWDK